MFNMPYVYSNFGILLQLWNSDATAIILFIFNDYHFYFKNKWLMWYLILQLYINMIFLMHIN